MASNNNRALDALSNLSTKQRNEERKALALAEDRRRIAAGQAAGRGKRRI